MEIVFQSHNATVSERTRQSAIRSLEKLARRLTRSVSGVIRFEEDGRMRRVELELQGRGRLLVAEGTGRYYGPALAAALAHLEAQLRRVGKLGTVRRSRARRPVRA
ncbi:MAG TPA: HPF/RaiA family ribosome-associated protein [Vicinamibacterales bacterium]|nr:HPF/RaiA family ribosome-associated protein [Gemmatimonadaceae bacterium]HYJ94472.1 HPF/RaiA family ribosome-associated protein [Vicinamibacterales bacterium]